MQDEEQQSLQDFARGNGKDTTSRLQYPFGKEEQKSRERKRSSSLLEGRPRVVLPCIRAISRKSDTRHRISRVALIHPEPSGGSFDELSRDVLAMRPSDRGGCELMAPARPLVSETGLKRDREIGGSRSLRNLQA